MYTKVLKIIAFTLCFALIAVLAACGGSSQTGTASTTAAQAQTTAGAAETTQAQTTAGAAETTQAQTTAAVATTAQAQTTAGAVSEASQLDIGLGPIVDEPLTLKGYGLAMSNQDSVFDGMWYYNELEKETNIHIEWEQVPENDYSVRMNLMFASGEYPDMILRKPDLVRTTDFLEEYGVNQGILIPLDDYFETYMPNYYSRLYLNDANLSLPSSDGKMYQIGNLIAQSVNHNSHSYINKTWLDNLGLEIPTTIDEFTDVLRAFRDGDPNGDGRPVWPISSSGLPYSYFYSFGVPMNTLWATVDGDNQVQFLCYYPGFRAACEWLNMLWTEKLLDPEGLTQDGNVWMSKVNDGIIGYMTYLRLINTALIAEMIPHYESILPPASEYGVQVSRFLEVPGFGASLTIANQHIPETLKWLDRQFETEHMMVAYNGPIRPGGPIEPTMEITPEGKYNVLWIPENNGLYQVVPVWNSQFFAPADYYNEIYEMAPHRVERYESNKWYADAGVLEPGSYTYLESMVKPSNEAALELTRIRADLTSLIQETLSDFIMNGVTDAKWNNFMNTCESVGVAQYIKIYQDALDAYFAQ